MRKFLIGACLTAMACSSAQADLSNAKKTLTVGSWSVLRDVNPMTDEVGCTGIYKGDYNLQLNESALYMRVRGGVKGVKFRFDDTPAQELRLATSIERKGSVVIVEGAEFDRLIHSRRLRYQVLTALDGLSEGDLDLSGIEKASDHIRAKCPP